eukprot:177539_1
MNDILEIGWIFTKQHEKSLIKCLKQYNSEYICNIIAMFLPSYKPSSSFNCNVDESDHIYHAYFHINISPMYNYGKAPCNFWLNNLKSSVPYFKVYNVEKQKMETLDTSDYPGIDTEKVPIIKVAVMGDGYVGKSALTLRHITNKFFEDEYYDPTIEDAYQKLLELNPNDKDINAFKIVHNEKCVRNDWDEQYKYLLLDVLDTAAQSGCWGWMREYPFFLLCFAVNSKSSFDHLESIRNNILQRKDYDKVDNRHDGNNLGFMIIGTKCDLRYNDSYKDKQDKFVSSEEALKLAKKWNVPYVETSALTGRNVNFAFRQMCYEYWIQSQTNCIKV